MATSFRKFLEGLRIIPKTASTASEKGDLDVTDLSGKLNYHNGTSASPVVTEAHQATLTNKTLTSPVLNTPTADTITGIAGGSLVIQSASNEDLSLQAQGTGSVSLEALTVDGNTVTGGTSALTVQSDTDQNLILQSQGTGNLTVQTTGTGSVTLDDVTTITGKTTSALTIQSSVGRDLVLTSSAFGGVVKIESFTVNFNAITGGNSACLIQSSNNQDISLVSNGTGNVSIEAYGTGQVTLEDVTSILGRAGSALTVQGATNQNINLTTSGSGVISATGATSIVANSASAGLRVTQTGSGNALLIEDSANPDSTPFVVDASGKVAIGATTANVSLDLASTFATRASDSLQTGTYVILNAPTTTFIRLNSAITYLSGIDRGANGQKVTLSNKTGSAITILNSSGPAGSDQYIVTGTGADIIFQNDATIEFIYNDATAKWCVIGSVAGNLAVNYLATSVALDQTYSVVLADAGSVPSMDITLPTSPAGKTFTIKKIDSTSTPVSVIPASGTIDGTTQKTLTGQYDAVQVITDGTNWYII